MIAGVPHLIKSPQTVPHLIYSPQARSRYSTDKFLSLQAVLTLGGWTFLIPGGGNLKLIRRWFIQSNFKDRIDLTSGNLSSREFLNLSTNGHENIH